MDRIFINLHFILRFPSKQGDCFSYVSRLNSLFNLEYNKAILLERGNPVGQIATCNSSSFAFWIRLMVAQSRIPENLGEKRDPCLFFIKRNSYRVSPRLLSISKLEFTHRVSKNSFETFERSFQFSLNLRRINSFDPIFTEISNR